MRTGVRTSSLDSAEGWLVTGRLADRYGPRPVLVFGALAMGGGLLATSMTT
ncbi:MAG: hypothetical protein P8N02_11210 [Actinomycetota bacterium]|nr:hypothetical protein [Actinomycetota bacterium]